MLGLPFQPARIATPLPPLAGFFITPDSRPVSDLFSFSLFPFFLNLSLLSLVRSQLSTPRGAIASYESIGTNTRNPLPPPASNCRRIQTPPSQSLVLASLPVVHQDRLLPERCTTPNHAAHLATTTRLGGSTERPMSRHGGEGEGEGEGEAAREGVEMKN